MSIKDDVLLDSLLDMVENTNEVGEHNNLEDEIINEFSSEDTLDDEDILNQLVEEKFKSDPSYEEKDIFSMNYKDDFNLEEIVTQSDYLSELNDILSGENNDEDEDINISELTEEQIYNLSDISPLINKLSIEQKELRELKKAKEFTMKNFGKEILELMEQPGLTEIMLRQTGYIWVEYFGKAPEKTNIKLNKINAERIIKSMADYNKTGINIKQPKFDGTTPNGMRMSAVIGDVVEDKPIFSIRKPSGVIIPRHTYVERGLISKSQMSFLEKSVAEAKNIIIAGPTGSGKTTFINSLIQILNDSNDIIITIEDTKELMLEIENRIPFLAIPGVLSQEECIEQSMRLNPDRIFIGEVRNGLVATALLDAWMSGHNGGMTSIHSSSVLQTIQRLTLFLDRVHPKSNHGYSIASAVDIIVCVDKDPITRERPKVKEIGIIKGYDEKTNKYDIEYVL